VLRGGFITKDPWEELINIEQDEIAQTSFSMLIKGWGLLRVEGEKKLTTDEPLLCMRAGRKDR